MPWHYLDRPVHYDRDYGHAGRDREHEGSLLEGTKRILVSAGPFRKHDDRVPSADSLGRDIVSAERSLSILALDFDHSHGAHCASEDRHFEELGFCHELVSGQYFGERGNVEPADVIGRENVWIPTLHIFHSVDAYLDPDSPEHCNGPPSRHFVVQAARFVLYTE